mgnify:CR=1 FL=1
MCIYKYILYRIVSRCKTSTFLRPDGRNEQGRASVIRFLYSDVIIDYKLKNAEQSDDCSALIYYSLPNSNVIQPYFGDFQLNIISLKR